MTTRKALPLVSTGALENLYLQWNYLNRWGALVEGQSNSTIPYNKKGQT